MPYLEELQEQCKSKMKLGATYTVMNNLKTIEVTYNLTSDF